MSTSDAARWLAGAAVVAAAALAAGAPRAFAQAPHLGMPVAERDIAAWSLNVLPDGTGLPPGSGTAAQGAAIYAEKCVACHGPNGEGGISAALVGGEPLTSGIDTRKTIKNFWPYATTLFDFVRRAMPWLQPRTLTNDQVYALTAYLLALNGIVKETDAMNAETLPQVRMPNRDGFVLRFPELTPSFE